MPRLWFLSCALLVFLMGAVTGAIAVRWAHWPWGGRELAFQGQRGVMDKFQKELAFTPYQVTQMEVILDQAARDFGALHARAHSLRGETRQRMRSILNDQQKKKFDGGLSNLERRFGSP